MFSVVVISIIYTLVYNIHVHVMMFSVVVISIIYQYYTLVYTCNDV